jgi:hypothetical protein
MFRRVVAVGAISLGFIAVLPAAATSAAMRPQVPGVGITTCHPDGGGTMTFSPPLLTAGVATSETVTLVATGKPCTGGTPTPHSFTLKAHATISGTAVNQCSDFFSLSGTGPPVTLSATFSGAIAWGSGITTSGLIFGTLKSSETLATAPIKFKAAPLKVTTSYPTTSGVFTFKTYVSAGTLIGQCGSSGVSGFDLLTTAGSGTF